MKKISVFFLCILLSTGMVFSQKVISGKSQAKQLVLTPEYSRGLPPDLYVDLHFEDDNDNGILEPKESAIVSLNITNKGKGAAQGLEIKLIDKTYDPHLKIDDNKKIPYLYPGQSVRVDIPISAGFNIESAEHKLEIEVKEYFGYDMDAAYLVLNTIRYEEPKLVLSGTEMVDIGEGTAAIKEDGLLQAGERVKVKIIIQNIGQNISENTKYYITTTNQHIYLEDEDKSGKLGNLGVGEVKEFWITLSPNKRVDVRGELPVYLTLSNKYERGLITKEKLPIIMNQKLPDPQIVKVDVDIESMQKKVFRFETNSNKITANIANIIDIKQVPPSKTIRRNSVAVIIGIEKYDNFVNAPYADNDAKLMKKYFKSVLGVDKVFLYTDDDVSGFFFDNWFNPEYGELQKAIIKGQTDLFVFYSGHGMPSKDGKSVYLFPSDGRIEALDRQGYNLNTFYTNLNTLGAKSTTVFIDACFSGVSRATEVQKQQNLLSMKGVSIKPSLHQPWKTNQNFTVFSSSSFSETSLGFDASETGLFTYYVCAGLQGKADINSDNKITAGELRDYVTENVSRVSVKILGKQTPVFHGNENMILSEF